VEACRRPFPKSGQGEARKVTRDGDDAVYVLKRMQPAQESRPDRRGRFQREIDALQKLDDPNILKIVDYGVDDRGAPYLVTPYCENGTLENLPRASVIDTLRKFHGICKGVAHAHEKNVIHRDLKPKNIFLDAKYDPIVGDFGLCFLLDDEAVDERLTEPMEVAGPRWFGAPEARDGRLEDVTPAGDVYSLGKLLHWMFSKQMFDRENHRALRYKLGKALADRREFELIDELLDRTYSRKGGFPAAVHRWTISPCSSAGTPSIERPNRSAFSSSSSEMSVSAICFASASVFGFLKLP